MALSFARYNCATHCVRFELRCEVRHPFLLFSSLFSSLSIPNSKVLCNVHLFLVFVTCEKLLMRLKIIKVMRENMRLRIVIINDA